MTAFSPVGRPYHVLILCTGNSARSILGEALIERWGQTPEGQPRFRGFSAGSRPKGRPHPAALALLSWLGFATAGLRSKSWDEFAAPGAPPLDIVITVCGSAAGEICPVWSGAPLRAHWGIDDPAAVEPAGPRQDAAFLRAYQELEARVKEFSALPVATMDRAALQRALDDIGRPRERGV
mgnify:CR=1 FL=1